MYAFFALGREPRLSIAEIMSVYGPRIHSYPLVTDELLIVEMDDFDAQEAAERLGGSVKYGEMERFDETDLKTMGELVANRIVMDHKKKNRDTRLLFGCSGFGSVIGKQFGFGIKSLLEREGYAARLATSKEDNMSAAAVSKARLLDKGTDIVVTRDGNTAWIGVTEAVQPFEMQSNRDYDRPARDGLRGMIPVQLARTLINIALPSQKESTLLDPFCGQGTVLMEAMLLGVKTVIGADIDPKAVKESGENLKWLKPGNDVQLITRDARETPMMPRLDAVVTEPFLGEPAMRPLEHTDINKRHKELGALYATSIRMLANALKPGAIIMMILPAFKLGYKFLSFPKAGILPASLEPTSLPTPGEPITENVIYKRADQFVGREILIARKK